MNTKEAVFWVVIATATILAWIVQASGTSAISLVSDEGLHLVSAVARPVEHDDRRGIRLAVDPELEGDREVMAVVEGVEFRDGTIELELAGEPAPGSVPTSRGFVGVAFHMDDTGYEIFYLRPTNGRAKSQLQRNHSAQYVSHPEYPWYRLRKESPGVYESYVDLEAGRWTDIKVEVHGKQAKLYVHGVDQPCLVVNDLKRGGVGGKVALWLHSTTVAHFRNLTITPGKEEDQ